ncbi:hypothetical protein [Caldimonas sp. KR1-144]|uniref:hypothetical protein n=1 Tax=Caldimonas sp. KR1-144 TaxID=3400911 RepID=UPI003C0BFDFA
MKKIETKEAFEAWCIERHLRPADMIRHYACSAWRTADDAWWTAREKMRAENYAFEDNQHKAKLLPYALTSAIYANGLSVPPQAYLQLDPENKTNVTFFSNWADGVRDRRTSSTFGRFLKWANPHAPDTAIQAAVNTWRQLFIEREIKFTQDGDLIEAIYLTGPTACMRYDKEHFGISHHPTRAYADIPGLKLAYFEPTPGRYTARCWTYENPSDTTDKRWIRCYGDELLLTLLEHDGFRAGSLDGVKLHRIHCESDPRKVICPYIDGAADNIQLLDDGLLVTDDIKYPNSSSDGYLMLSDFEPSREDQVQLLTRFYGEDHWIDQSNATYCERYADYIDDEDLVELYEGDWAHVNDENLATLSTRYYRNGGHYTFRNTVEDGNDQTILDDDAWYDEVRKCYWHHEVSLVTLIDGRDTRHDDTVIEDVQGDYELNTTPHVWFVEDEDQILFAKHFDAYDLGLEHDELGWGTTPDEQTALLLFLAPMSDAQREAWLNTQIEVSHERAMTLMLDFLREQISNLIISLPLTAVVIEEEEETA